MRRQALAAIALVLAVSSGVPAAQQSEARDDAAIAALIGRLEDAVRLGSREQCLALLATVADQVKANDFCSLEMKPGASFAIVHESERLPLDTVAVGAGFRLIVEAFVAFGPRGRVATWALDVVRSADTGWRIVDEDRFSSLEQIFRLSVTTSEQYEARDFTVRSKDLVLTLERGSVFVVRAEDTVTGLVLLGRGTMNFSPPSDAEKGQIRILAGEDRLDTRFDSAFIRVGDFDAQTNRSALTPRKVDPEDVQRAEQIFREESPRSLSVDVADFNQYNWSFLPRSGDLIAEVRTREFGTLTYGRGSTLPEDVSLINRAQQKQIALYASEENLARFGRFYDASARAEFDILDYELDAEFTPERPWLDARAQVRVRVTATSTNQLSFRLADSLTVRSVSSDLFGRMLALRVPNQDTIIVSLPATVLRDTEMTLTMAYRGRVAIDTSDGEDFGAPPQLRVGTTPADGTYLLSNRSFWYPQGPAPDFATARLRITIPVAQDAIASGVRTGPAVPIPGFPPMKTLSFTVENPVRYFSVLVGPLVRVENAAMPAAAANGPALQTYSTRRQIGREGGLAERASAIVAFYRSILGDVPYPALSIAALTRPTPGGYSPAYFIVLAQPPANVPRRWSGDPAAFDDEPDFLLAHEIAHQWWGQAVGWRNYHEQWLSEGFAQYFAALYVRHQHGEEAFDRVMRQMRRWADERSDEGPVYLGYRVGHLRSDGRSFRAIVYNKGAAVLDMLRQLAGERAFMDGLRTFYGAARFTDVGTNDLQKAMEAATGERLDRFFDGWIFGMSLPQVRVSHRTEHEDDRNELVLRAEQQSEEIGEIFDFPVTVTLRYADRTSEEVVLAVSARTAEKRVALRGRLQDVEVEGDGKTLARIRR